MTCPKCNGEMWDNRQTKLNPRQPDFKCKDKSCDGVIWPPRNKAPQTMAQYNQENGYDQVDTTPEPTGYERAKMVREQLTAVSAEERSRRIERQHQTEMALRLLAIQQQAGQIMEVSFDDVKHLTDQFMEDLNEN